jgi:glycosyltransferase involved in cell wall biosynthesis
MKRFFVVTPSYNQGHFLAQTIESILQQNANAKYWVIDGKSNDNSMTVLKKYTTQLSWVSEKDHGQTDAINKGMRKFSKEKTGKGQTFFAYINSDDYYLPGAFQKVEKAFHAHPEKMWLVGDCQIVDEKGIRIHQPIGIYKKILRQVYQPWMLYILNPFPQPAVFIRWEAVKKVGEFNQQLRYTMDYEYWLRLQAAFGAPLSLIDELAAFRVHGASKGGSQFLKQFDEQYQTAHHFTQNPILLFLHHVHNWMTKGVYSLIK